ncbi:hypothetical protein CVT26_013221 [Gymnopilus dilepis]|uniref:Uncharacterized protein n=1 Tax=Gymnopilus dilepis TaxID=231916 RepID=A0A409WZZ7_9AGAR|nr:hypothetical protein CVT26_013221 [Gymnopilus dilepis]
MRAFADDDKQAAAQAPDEGDEVDDGAIEAGDEGEE